MTQDVVVDLHRPGEPLAAVDDAVADGEQVVEGGTLLLQCLAGDRERLRVRRAVDGPLGAVSGGTFAEPVLVRVLGDEVSVSAEVCVAAESSAPDIARAVGSAVREWCRREHPGRRARIAVRIASVD